MPFTKNLNQHESLKNGGFKAKLGYFWDYYKVHTFVAICLIIVLITMIYENLNSKDTVFYAAMVHCSDVSEETTTTFRENYIAYAGIDLNKHEIQLNSDPSQLMLTMATAQVDVVISDADYFSYEAGQNKFYDLREVLTEEQLAKYEPYFYYADQTILDARKKFPESEDLENAYPDMLDPRKPEEMEQPVPVGLFVSDCTALTEAYYFDNDDIALGVVGNAQHLENTLKFIDYLFESSLAVECSNGIFIGQNDRDVVSYKGIPYAKAPVGTLRWQPPQPPKDSTEVYEAYEFGKSSLQKGAEVGDTSLNKYGEDCLTLNIWKSAENKDTNKPVMVFIHGGSFSTGGTSDATYDGTNFITNHNDVILVTINYRLGIMGFLDLSGLEGGEDYAESGNLGLLDQVCALQWIQDNIANFGGDPSNVTIFGQSAGGASVSLLPLINGTQGLFQRVIAQSGSPCMTYSTEECRTLTQKIIQKTGAKSVDDLLALSEEELVNLINSLGDEHNYPERDGIVLPTDLYAAYQNPELKNIDFLLGTNRDEFHYWIPEFGGKAYFKTAVAYLHSQTMRAVTDEDGELISDFLELQSGDSTRGKTEFLNELLFRIPAIAQAERVAANGGNVYMYYWTYPLSEALGACHTADLGYVFGHLDNEWYASGTPNKALSETVMEMWVNFAKTGNPSTSKYTWNKYDSNTRATMILGADIHEENDLLAEQRELLMPLINYYINGYF